MAKKKKAASRNATGPKKRTPAKKKASGGKSKKKASASKSKKKAPASKSKKKATPATRKLKKRPAPWDGTDPDELPEEAEKACGARDACYATLGAVSPYVLAPLIGPLLTGEPDWPGTRPAWSVIRRPGGGTVMVSNGLSTPVKGAPSGFGLEVLVECDESIDFDEAAGSWPFGLVQQVSVTCAGHGGVRPLLDELGLVSMELAGDGLPEEWQTEGAERGGDRSERRGVGVLLGVGGPSVPAKFELDGGDVKLVTITLLRPDELAWILANPETGRPEIAKKLRAAGHHHVSSLSRPSVL